MKRLDFEKLYETYYMQVYSYIMTIVKNPHDAEEITQQTFFKAMRHEASFQKQSSEVTWLCSIAKNLAMDQFRRKRHFQENKTENAGEDRIEEKLIDQEMSLQIHQILHEIEEPYKEVFQLRIFGELAFSQIAIIFGKSESWARVTYHRARRKIQERMRE